jgi:ATP-dependent Zn protease
MKIFFSNKITVVSLDDLKQARSKIEKIVGVPDMKDKSRKVEFTAARAIMATYCKSLGMSRDQIAPIVGRREGSIQNMLISHQSWLRTWTDYRVWFDKFKKEIA